MGRYVVRRALQAIPLLIGISAVAFVLMRLAPGGPMAVYAQNPTMTEADLRRIEHLLGLDQPIHVQYLKWASGMATGNWGYSYRTGRPVADVILERVPATIQLMGLAYLIAIGLGLAIGILSALKRYTIFDYIATTGAMIGLSLPTFWFGLMVIFLFAATLHWIPSGGMATLGEPFSIQDRLVHLAGPASVLGLWMTATWCRYTRSSMLEVIGQDYIRTAHAKGLPSSTVLVRHALKNAVIPLVTLMGLELRYLFSGALVTETVFAWPGIGILLIQSIEHRDFPLVEATVFVIAIMVVVMNLLVDLLYTILDPRVRYS